MAVQMRIDALQVKSALNKVVKNKIKKVYTNESVHYMILEDFYWEHIYPYLDLFDTGAFADAASGQSSKTGYWRSGTLTISPHHGIERDSFEERPNGEHHYFKPLASQRLLLYGKDPNGKNIYDAMTRSEKKHFLDEVSNIITGAMNE